MSLPLVWHGDGPPQPPSRSSSPQHKDQFDASHSLASLTFVAAQLSTLLQTVNFISSADAPPALNPHPTTTPRSPLTSRRRLHCHVQTHSLSVGATSSAPSPSAVRRLPLTHPAHTPLTSQPSLAQHSAASQPPSQSCSISPRPTPSISVPPRFTIRVITDLEPVTLYTSRSSSPWLH